MKTTVELDPAVFADDLANSLHGFIGAQSWHGKPISEVWNTWECESVAQRLNLRDTPEDISNLSDWLNRVTFGYSIIRP